MHLYMMFKKLEMICAYRVANIFHFSELPSSDNPDPADDDLVDLDADNSEDDVSGTTLLKNILNQVENNHVTRESLMRWTRQIREALNRGALTTDTVNRFVAVLKEKLADTPVGESCCVFG